MHIQVVHICFFLSLQWVYMLSYQLMEKMLDFKKIFQKFK